MKKGRIAVSLIAVLICFVCLSSAKLMKKKETPKEAVKQEEIKKENVKEEVIPAEKENKETTATDEKVIVKTGAVIIDGRYIEPPYEIEARDNAIWINGVLAEKIYSKKERNSNIKEIKIKNEIFIELFKLYEKEGWQKAYQKTIEKIKTKNNIGGVDVQAIQIQANIISISLHDKQCIKIEIPTEITNDYERMLFGKVLFEEYSKWINTNTRETYNELIKFLEKHKEENRIDEYSFENNILKYSYGKYWRYEQKGYQLWPNSVENSLVLNDEEIEDDRQYLKKRFTIIKEGLEYSKFQAFSGGGLYYSGPLDKFQKLKEIMQNDKLSDEEKKKQIIDAWGPATNEKHLEEIMKNFR